MKTITVRKKWFRDTAKAGWILRGMDTAGPVPEELVRYEALEATVDGQPLSPAATAALVEAGHNCLCEACEACQAAQAAQGIEMAEKLSVNPPDPN